MEPDQIDMMSEQELKLELRKLVKENITLRAKIKAHNSDYPESVYKLTEIEKLIYSYGQIDGDHHKTWVLDQIMRIIKGDKYDGWVDNYEHTDNQGKSCDEREYTWEVGIAP